MNLEKIFTDTSAPYLSDRHACTHIHTQTHSPHFGFFFVANFMLIQATGLITLKQYEVGVLHSAPVQPMDYFLLRHKLTRPSAKMILCTFLFKDLLCLS